MNPYSRGSGESLDRRIPHPLPNISHVWQSSPRGVLLSFSQSRGNPTFENCKYSRIWTNGNPHLWRFLSSTQLPSYYLENLIGRLFTNNNFFLNYLHQYTPLSMWDPHLYKSSMRIPYFRDNKESLELLIFQGSTHAIKYVLKSLKFWWSFTYGFEKHTHIHTQSFGEANGPQS